MKLVLLLAMLLVNPVAAQKVVRKIATLPRTNLLQIDAGQCYSVELETAAVDVMEVEATMEGEYGSDILLNLGEEGSTTRIEAGVQPFFNLPDDKLSAHKVIAISLKILLPQNRSVQIYGRSATIAARGRYEKLHIILDSGGCSLFDVSRLVEVSTRTADIYVESPGATILAKSRYGVVNSNLIPAGDARYRLRTISGDIRLIRME